MTRQYGSYAGHSAGTPPAARFLVVVRCCLLVGAVVLSGCAQRPVTVMGARADSIGAARTDDISRAQRLALRVDSFRTAAHIPGLAMAVLRDTTVLLAQGFGFADLEQQRAVTPDTPFDIASVSKPVSAVVALQLVEAGLLDLDRPMQRYRDFPEFCTGARSGGGIFFTDFDCIGDRLTMRHVLAMQANGTAGSRFLYNPPSFSWASRPMAQVAGVTFSDLVDSLVFRRAGMRGAARINRNRPLLPSIAAVLARPYTIDSAGRAVAASPPPPQGDGAAGGVIASVADLIRFDIALMSGRLISERSRAMMWTPGRSREGALLPYGLGWFTGEAGGTRVVWHTGLWDGRYSALYVKVPERRLTMLLLANSEGLQWPARLNEAAIERSPYARAFFAAFMDGYTP